jgi:UPF0755 protein
MKKLLLVLLFVFFAVIGTVFTWWWWVNLPPASAQQRIFVVKKGESVQSIGQRLKADQLIKSPLAFKLTVYQLGISKNIQAGSFRLSAMKLADLAQNLTQGSLDFWVTIPEGLRVEEIAAKIAQSAYQAEADFNTQEFIQLARSYEGYLFPDTYLIPHHTSSQQILTILKNTFNQKYQLINNQTELTDQQVVILASLVEREAKYEQDRPIIAGIILKRWQNDWPLQIDATIQYLLGYQKDAERWWKQTLTKQDLSIDSPFNTYLNIGLPPQPICSPGLSALQAAADPQQTDYWFYISDPSGKSHFATDIDEHNVNINKYLTN